MTEKLFTRESTWGGTYDLELELGPVDDQRLTRALHALWSSPDLEGCYARSDREPHEQALVDVGTLPIESALYGIARVGSWPPVPCSTIVVRTTANPDWICFYIPLNSLEHIDAGDLVATGELDAWLRGIAERVFAVIPFRFGIIGAEGSGHWDAAKVASSGVPHQRRVGYLVPTEGQLQWFAPNCFEHFYDN